MPVTRRPFLLRQAGLKVAVDEILQVGPAPQGLVIRPVLRGEAGVSGEELRSFHLGLLDAAELCETGGQNTLRPRAVRRLVPQRFDSVFIPPGHILDESEMPVVPAGRMRIEAKRLAQVLDALDGAPL